MGDFDDIDAGQVHAVDIAADSGEIAEGFEGGIIAIAENDKEDGKAKLRCAPERLNGILDGAIADGANDTAAGIGELEADSGGQTEAQDAIGDGVKGARLVGGEVAVEIALGGRAFFANDGIVRLEFIEETEEKSRSDGMAGRRIGRDFVGNLAW